MTLRTQHVLGWTGVVLSTFAACFWAFWGIIENFHEGWHRSSLGDNLALMLVQYLSAMLIFVAAGVVAIRWPRLGGGLHFAAAAGAGWFFRGASPLVVYPFLTGPLVLMGFAYWLGRPEPRHWAILLVVGLPVLTMLVCGVEPAYRVSRRYDDGDRNARRIAGNGLNLILAPEGPGWPKSGVTWDEAVRICKYLAEDGTSLASTPQNIRRLPTAEEAVRSMHRHGKNSGGTWDTSKRVSKYEVTPDKESPLWDVHSQVIYWWTSTELNDQQALIIVYDGKVWPRQKKSHWGYLGFRAIKDLSRS